MDKEAAEMIRKEMAFVASELPLQWYFAIKTNGKPVMTPEAIHRLLEQNLPCTHLEVEGDGHHFYAVVVSTVFEGLTRIRRHQAVYAALNGAMEQAIHALSMQTYTPEEWEARRG